jgi:hypothetical protein
LLSLLAMRARGQQIELAFGVLSARGKTIGP